MRRTQKSPPQRVFRPLRQTSQKSHKEINHKEIDNRNNTGEDQNNITMERLITRNACKEQSRKLIHMDKHKENSKLIFIWLYHYDAHVVL